MRVQVLYFGFVRERVARRRADLMSVPEGSTVHDVVDAVSATYPQFGLAREIVRLAVNEEIAPLDRALRDGDVVALIPPVAGGSGPYARVTAQPPDLQQIVRAVAGPGRGGVVSFIGYVRDHNEGRSVSRLDYEAYRPMAERGLAEIVARCERAASDVRVAVAHRIGTLEVGDIAVVIAAAAPHRAEAFEAARTCIELIKVETTIWKKEYGPDGAEWLGVPDELRSLYPASAGDCIITRP